MHNKRPEGRNLLAEAVAEALDGHEEVQDRAGVLRHACVPRGKSVFINIKNIVLHSAIRGK